MIIDLREITEENFFAIINMKMPEDQHFVAPNAISLAQAWLHRENARPYAIYHQNELVGFIMLDWNEHERSLGIWRLMIALEHQGKGYGQAVVDKVIDMARQSDKFDNLCMDYVPENKIAEHIYYKAGFRPTGEIEDGEIVMKMDL